MCVVSIMADLVIGTPLTSILLIWLSYHSSKKGKHKETLEDEEAMEKVRHIGVCS